MERYIGISSATSIAADPLWKDHCTLLKDLYINQNLPLKRVKDIMEREHEFPEFPLSIYEARLRDTLGLVKNLKKEHWQAVHSSLAIRERHGKLSIVYHNGRIVSNKKISKERRRYKTIANYHQKTVLLPPSVMIRTPSPVPLPHATAIAPEEMSSISLLIPKIKSPALNTIMNSALSIELKLPKLYHLYSANLQNLPSLVLESKLVELFTRNSVEPVSVIEPSALQIQPFNAFRGQPWETKPAAAITSLAPTLPRQLAVALSRMANGFKLCHKDIETLRQWILSLPSDSVRLFFRINIPILKPIWRVLADFMFGKTHQSLEKDIPCVNQQERDLFRILIEVGLKCGGLINRSSSRCITNAIHLDCQDLVQPLLDFGVSTSGRGLCSHFDGFGIESALLCAVFASKPLTLSALIAGGEDIEARDRSGLTLLGYCVRVMHWRPKGPSPSDFQCLEVLLTAGANVDTPTFRGKIPSILDMAFLTKRDTFGALLPHSTVFDSFITVCGVLKAAEDGEASLESYLSKTSHLETVDTERHEILHYALLSSIEEPQIVKVLLECGIDANAVCNRLISDSSLIQFEACSALGCAITTAITSGLSSDIRNSIKQLLGMGAVVTETILAGCCVSSGCELLQLLASTTDDIRTLGRLALGVALLQENKTAVDYLLSRGVDINCSFNVPGNGHLKLSPLQFALEGLRSFRVDSLDAWLCRVMRGEPGSLEIVKYAILHGADVNAPGDISRPSTLHSAVLMKNATEAIELLLKHGASQTAQQYGLDLVLNCVKGSMDLLPGLSLDFETILDILFRRGAIMPYTALLTMLMLGGASRGMIDSVLIKLDYITVDVNAKNFPAYGSIYEPSVCVSTYCDSTYRDSYIWGYSPLRASVLLGDVDLVQKLISRGGDINEPAMVLGKPHRSRIHMRLGEVFSCSPFKLSTLQMVCWACWFPGQSQEHKAGKANNPGEQEDAVNSAPYLASDDARLEIANLLLEYGADINAAAGQDGVTALQLAAESGDLRLCMLLLHHGAHINASSCSLAGIVPKPVILNNRLLSNQIYPLDSAAWFGRLDVVQFLLNCGAESFRQRLSLYDGAICLAKKRGHTGVVDILFQQFEGLMSSSEWEQQFGNSTIEDVCNYDYD